MPDLTNAQAIARVFDVAIDDLVNHDESLRGYPIPPRGKHIFGMVRVGERGQIVIPKKARDIFGLKPGSELLMLGDETQGIALQRAEDALAVMQAYGKAMVCGVAFETIPSIPCELCQQIAGIEFTFLNTQLAVLGIGIMIFVVGTIGAIKCSISAFAALDA